MFERHPLGRATPLKSRRGNAFVTLFAQCAAHSYCTGADYDMSDTLRRKLSAKRVPKASNGVSVEALLRKTMPRDADTVLSLDLAVTDVSTGLRGKADVLDWISEFHLAFLLETEDGLRGVTVLDPGLLSGLVEVQVSGRVTDKPVVERKPTRTDAIVVSEITDAWLATTEAEMEKAGLDTAWPLSGFERENGHLTRREVDLLLEPVEFRWVEITLSLCGGAKTGMLHLAVPRRDASHDGHAHSIAEGVRTHLPDLPVALHAVLTRMPLDMARAQSLSEDEVLPLPEGCLQKVRLETATKRLIRHAQLGQLDGKRAVRIGEGTRKPEMGMLSAPVQAAAAPALPDLPAPPPADGPDLPELPDLPDLPDRPELPDLP